MSDFNRKLKVTKEVTDSNSFDFLKLIDEHNARR